MANLNILLANCVGHVSDILGTQGAFENVRKAAAKVNRPLAAPTPEMREELARSAEAARQALLDAINRDFDALIEAARS